MRYSYLHDCNREKQFDFVSLLKHDMHVQMEDIFNLMSTLLEDYSDCERSTSFIVMRRTLKYEDITFQYFISLE